MSAVVGWRDKRVSLSLSLTVSLVLSLQQRGKRDKEANEVVLQQQGP